MKIFNTNIQATSQHSYRQMDLSLKEESHTSLTGPASILSGNRSRGWTNELPVMVVDRVSLSQSQEVEYQSNYSGDISSRSVVRSENDGETNLFEQKKLVEKLVGGVIDRGVVVRQIQQGENISILKSFPPPTSFPQPAPISSPGLSGEQMISLKQTDIRFEEEQMHFASAGKIVTEDGRSIEFSLDLSMDRAFLSTTEQESLVHTWREQVVLTDPLVISLDGRLPALSDIKFEFDLNNDGEMEKVSFVSPGSGFLAFDKNQDQKINNGSELFGPGTGNGFEELAVWDDDKNNWIDENDAIFSKLSVWTKDEDGKDRLISLKDAGIGAIFLENAATQFDMAAPDNTLKGRLKSSGLFLFENGSVGSVQQIDLATRPIERETSHPELKITVNRRLPFPSALDRGPLLPASGPAMGSLEGQVKNPLEALVEQIKKLREEMDRILGRSSSSNGVARFQGGLGGRNGFVFSNYQRYRINPVSFFRH